MREFLRFIGRPGIFIGLIGIVVVFVALTLCFKMTISFPGAGQDDGAQAAVFIPDDLFPPAPRSGIGTTRELLNMSNLAFEETLKAGPEDMVRQVDFALIQAMRRCNIPLEDAVIEKTELRHAKTGPYNFQRLRLFVGNEHLPFIASLQEFLLAWAEKAQLSQAEAGKGTLWIISADGVVTHELVLASTPSKETEEDSEYGRLLHRRAGGDVARLVIVIDDIGEDMKAAAFLAKLPYPVTFAVWPRSTHARRAAETAHATGREVIIHQPAEPIRYPRTHPGPGALFTSFTNVEIGRLVRDSLTRVPYAVGINNHMGSRFTRDRRAASAMVRVLKDRGIFVLDSLTHPGSVLHHESARLGIPVLKRDIFLDADPGKENVLRQLHKAERIALITGSAVAIGHPLPDTMAALKEWEARRDARVELVRLSDLIVSQRP